jgi:hypothetical protein
MHNCAASMPIQICISMQAQPAFPVIIQPCLALARSLESHWHPSSISTVMVVNTLAGCVVVACGSFLIGLAVCIFAKPKVAERFLLSFAGSARTHYMEQILRLLFGMSLVVFAASMWQANIFRIIGWAIIVSSAVLLVIPWRWHHHFGQKVLPMVARYMRLYAIGSLAFGVLLLYAVFGRDA